MKKLVVILTMGFVLANLLAVFFPQILGMDTIPSWTSSGDNKYDARFGNSVASAGDVNGDGYGDVIIGANEYDTANSGAGKAYLYLGNSSGLETSPSWTSSGDDQTNARFGNSVASAGDVNGDGYGDVIIGAHLYNTANSGAGKAYLYLGSSSGLETSPSWTSSGDDQTNAYFGWSVASADDVNGDGYSDVIIGAHLYNTANSSAGKAYLYLGSSSGLETSPSWTSSGDDQAYARFGWSVASAGDANGDGYDDVIISAYGYNSYTGKAYVYFGSSSGLETSPSWTSSGDDQVSAIFGNSVASADDVNGDGYSDVIIGAYTYDTSNGNAGKAYLYLGSSSGLETSPSWTSSGDNQTNARFGKSVASADDVNGDGYSDVIIGAERYDTANNYAGKAYLYLGSSSGLETSPSWTSSGDDQAYAYFGWSVASAGDVNGDGYGDVIIGAPLFNTANTDAGKAYLYLGSDTAPPAAPTNLTANATGNSGEIELDWNDNTEADLDHYSIYRRNDGDWHWVDNTIASYYLDSGLTDGVTYNYYVTASDNVPNESDPSNEANATPYSGNPVADAGPDQESFNGRTVDFDGSNSYDPDGTIVNWTWDFGNGMVGYGKTTTHVYSTCGVYNVILTVKDNDGRTDIDTAIVTIWHNGHDLSILKVQSPHNVRMGSTKTVVVWIENLGSYADYGLLSLTITAPDGTKTTLTKIVKDKDGTSLDAGSKVRISFSVHFNQRGVWTFHAHVDISDSNGNINPFPLKDCNPTDNDGKPTYGTDCK